MTQPLDPTADTVILELHRREVPVFRFDRSWFPDRLSLEAELTEKGWSGRLYTASRSVELHDIRSVWVRWRSKFRFSTNLDPGDRIHAEIEARAGFDGVLAGLNALYVNHPSAVSALTKPAELKLAIECGFSVPNTLITNRPDRVLAAARHNPVLRKLFSCHVPGPGGRSSIGHCRIPTEQDLTEIDSVRLTAHQIQEYIDKEHDVRVVAIGDRLFPIAIFPMSGAARVDFRSDYVSLSYGLMELPADVEGAIREFMKRADLQMASFDLTVDHTGRYFFLESNPAGGQYSWLEARTGASMSAALADLLVGEDGGNA